MTLFEAPSADLDLKGQIEHLMQDIRTLRQRYPDAQPILIDLLPACVPNNLENTTSLDKVLLKRMYKRSVQKSLKRQSVMC